MKFEIGENLDYWLFDIGYLGALPDRSGGISLPQQKNIPRNGFLHCTPSGRSGRKDNGRVWSFEKKLGYSVLVIRYSLLNVRDKFEIANHHFEILSNMGNEKKLGYSVLVIRYSLLNVHDKFEITNHHFEI